MPALRGALPALGDWLAFPSLLPAGVAATLLLAACRAMELSLDWTVAGLAAAGTVVVYNVDRLRDVPADRETSPLRTSFIERHRPKVLALTLAATAASIVLAWQASRDVQLLCAGVLVVGLLHRRLKTAATWKLVYVSAAWVCVTAGIPALTASNPEPMPWLFVIYTTTIVANLLATRLRAATDVRILWTARTLALAATATALLAPAAVQPLAAIPACELIALAIFRPGERYGMVVVDGALLAGALASLALWR